MIPLEDFFRKPEKVSLQLSPNGRHLAYLAPFERRLNLFVLDLDELQDKDPTQLHGRRLTEARERDLGGFLWANDERLIYAQDRGGDENYRLYAVSRDGSEPLDLTPFDGVKCGIVDDLEEIDDEILIQMNRRQAELFDVYRLNVSTAELQICGENPGNIQSWMTDHDGRLRLATTTDGVHTSILARDQEDQPWRTVATYDFKESATPLLFSFDNQDVFVSSNVGRDKAAIFRYDLKNGSESELIAEHEAVDLSRLLYSRRRKVLTAVAFETDRRGYQFFDETRATIQALLDEQLPDTENALTSHSRDESRYVVYAGSDRTRGHYHLLDRNSNQLQKLFDLSPWLRQEEMARLQPIGVTSRDGWNLPGYVTRPVGVEGGPGPLIVHPHGGPWHRDSFGFQAEVQFLASRGYSVLQVNFRGSTGYGRKFWEASFGEWGGCMQDDITDAVQWAIDTDIADPKRIGIYGGSYGGYATLAGLTKTPDLYACGVSFVGPSNLFTFLESIPPYWKPFLEMMHEMVGHPERDQARLRETSPFFQADRICAPLLVAQGANDPRVKKAESDQIVSALQKRGVPVQYLVKENEGHGFHNEENMFEFYRILEQFLAEHLQP